MRLFRSIGLPEQRNIGLRFLNARLKSSSSSRWLDRQNSDVYTLKARAEDYRSRAAYKLKAMDKKFHVFKRGMTVVDLGFAPGSWCQVAVEQTRPNGRVVGVDLIPIQPPEGVSTIQGNFLDPLVQKELKDMLATVNRGRANAKDLCPTKTDFSKAYADVVLSDMCGIWPQENNFWLNSINTPYRLANISGNPTRDHGMSMVSTLSTTEVNLTLKTLQFDQNTNTISGYVRRCAVVLYN